LTLKIVETVYVMNLSQMLPPDKNPPVICPTPAVKSPLGQMPLPFSERDAVLYWYY